MSGASRVLYQKDPLAWCFRMLTSDLRDKPTPQIVLAELDRLLELDPAQNERFDQTLRSLLSNLAICWRMHEMLRFHRPSYQPQNMRGVLFNNEQLGYEKRIWFSFCCFFIQSMLDARFPMTTHCLASIERSAPIQGRKTSNGLRRRRVAMMT